MRVTHEQDPRTRSVWATLVVGALCLVALVVAACGGGTVTVTTQDDTVARWTELAATDLLPQPRSGMSMVFDPERSQVILFGGWDADTDFGDTWVYDPDAQTWVDRTATAGQPAPRALYQAAWDSVAGKLVLFGGTSDAGRYGDTWIYDPSANTWTAAGGAVLPMPRSAHAMVYDSSVAKCVLFGGVGDAGRFDDTWVYDSQADSWTAADFKDSTPSPRSGHALVFDAAEGVSLLFGGFDGTSLLNDTWSYDAQTNTWAELEPAGAVPSARGNHRMVYDSDTGMVVLFGGYDGSKELSDVWVYHPKARAWQELQPLGAAPAAREEHAMVYDPSVGRVLMFGGFDDTDTELDDLWDFTITP